MMNKEEILDIKKQLEEIKDCGSKFNDVQYYCLYKYDIERIIPYIENLQQRITRAIEYIGNKNIGIPRKTREKAIAILGGKE